MEHENNISGANAAPSAKKRRKGAAGLGLFVILLAVVGFATLVSGGVKLFFNLTDDTADREAYSYTLSPIVMLDTPNFTDPSKLSKSMTLQTTIWSLLQDTDITRFNEDELGRVLLPFSDLQVACAKLYGGLATLPKESISADGGAVDEDSEGVIFEYMADIDCYALPIMGEIGIYTAKVEKMQYRKGDLYLLVGYYPTADNWLDQFTEQKSTDIAEKHRVFVMKKSESGAYYVYSLQNADTETVDF